MNSNAIIKKLNEVAEDLENKGEYRNAEKLVDIANIIDRMETNISKLYSIAWEMQDINRPIAKRLYHLINDIDN